MKSKVNIGCGSLPTEGWENYDNSPSILISKSDLLVWLLSSLRLISPSNLEVINSARVNNIQFLDATKQLPFTSNSLDAIYSSHMLEHFDRNEARFFLVECLRVLKYQGVIRILVPNFRKQILEYCNHGDMDVFMEKSLLTINQPKSVSQKFKLAFIGLRNHLWMYDESSLTKLIKSVGFSNVKSIPFGQTNIKDPGKLNLWERSGESICIEASK